MSELFDVFPFLTGEKILIHKMTENDVDALYQITQNENVYRYIPPFLYKKSRNTLLTAIRNLGGRDFEKKKHIIAGVYARDRANELIGLAEIFDYKKRVGQVTIGYRISECCWHCGIAIEIIALLKAYLFAGVTGIQTLKAFVMPDNIYSAKALLRNGFIKEPLTSTGENWGGQNAVILDVYTYSPRTVIGDKSH